MLLELGIPQGKVDSRWRGGDKVVKEAMEKVKSSSFTGYLKVSLSQDGERSEGLVSFSSGAPSLCLYVFQPIGAEEIWFLGEKGAEYLLNDALNGEAVVSLHAEVALKDFERLFPQARVRKVTVPRKAAEHSRLREEKLRGSGQNTTSAQMMKGLGTDQADRRKVDQQAQGVYDLILQYHKMQTEGTKINVCKECGGPVDLMGYCPHCEFKDEAPKPASPRMDPRFTFESFVAGSNTRFAEAAARAAADEPGELYNPLFIHGRSGLGKTHLLQAIGHRFKKDRQAATVTYIPLESLDEKALDALVGRQGDLHREMESTDMLLIDDFQFLSSRERLQEELLRIIAHLISQGKQVILSADRAPRDIAALSDRLTSRIESGLVVDMGQPDIATRVDILKSALKDEGLAIPDEVITFVAEKCPDNVRQLEGGINRVIAFASLMRSDINLDMAREVLGHEQATELRRVELEIGRSYIVEETRPEHSYELLTGKLDAGLRGLVFTRTNPASVRAKLGGRRTEIFWLTEHESKGEKTIPPSLEKIVLLVEEHVRKEGASIILLDDLHYLISNATFDGVIRFVRSLIDLISEQKAVFVISVSPDSLKAQERSVLERELEPIVT